MIWNRPRCWHWEARGLRTAGCVPALAVPGRRRQHRCRGPRDGRRDDGEQVRRAGRRRQAQRSRLQPNRHWIRLNYRFRRWRNLHGYQWAQCSSRRAASRRLFPGLYAWLTPRSHRGRAKTRRVKATSSQVCPAGGGHRRLRCLILESRKGIDAISHADGYAEPPSFSMPHILCGRDPARLTFSRLPSLR